VKRWPEKESCTTQDAVAAGSPSAADGAVQKAPQINQSGAHEPKRKGKAPLISRKREGAKHKKITSTVLRHRPPAPPPPSTPETLAAAAITAPLDASGAIGRRSAACRSPVRAPGAALRSQSLSRAPCQAQPSTAPAPPFAAAAWQFRAAGRALFCSGSTGARLGFFWVPIRWGRW